MNRKDRYDIARLYQAAEMMGEREKIFGLFFNPWAAYSVLRDGLRPFLTKEVK